MNDVVNQKSRFAVLLLNFMLGTAMILLPLSAWTTLKGEVRRMEIGSLRGKWDGKPHDSTRRGWHPGGAGVSG